MHILASSGTVKKYPYSIGQFRKDNPQVSFPRDPSEALLALYGVYPVIRTDQPEYDRITHDLSEATPELVGSSWRQTWVLTPVSAEVAAERLAELADDVRRDRNRRLQDSDWVVIKAYERGENIPMEWEVYRQALRDITDQAGFPYEVTWPAKPA